MFKKKESKEELAEPKAEPAAAAAAADAIIKAMPDALILLDLEGRIVSLNPAYTRMFGWKPEDRIGKSFTEFKTLKAEEIERFMKLLGELIETGHVEPLETVIGTKDDREVPISVGYSLIKDAEGNPNNIIAVLRDITELKKKTEELEEKKLLLNNIFASTIDSIAIVNIDGAITDITKVSLERSGYSMEEMTGNIPTFLISEEDRAKFPNLLAEVIQKGFIKNVEMTEITKDGRRIPVMFNATLMKDAKGEPTGIVAVSRDITELKRLQEKEKEKEVAVARVAAETIEAMGDGIVLSNMDGQVISVNPALEKMSGYEKSEQIGKNVAEMIPKLLKPEDIEKATKVLGSALEGKFLPSEPLTLIAKDGRETPITFSISFIKDAEGKPTAGFAVLRDIAELKRAEEGRVKAEAAAGARRAMENVMNTMVDTLVVVDPDGSIRMANKALSDILGYKEKELIGKSVDKIFAPPRGAAAAAAAAAAADTMFKGAGLEKLMKDGFVKDEEMTYLTKKGKKIPMSFSGSVMKDEKGGLAGIVCVAKDLSEIKRMVEELKTLEKMKTDFLNIVAHELRTPLTPVRAYIELMSAGKLGRITWQQKEKLEIADKSIDTLARLVDDILSISRITAEKLELGKEQLSVSEVIDIAYDGVGSLLGKKHRVMVRVPDDLPMVYGDKKMMVRVFDNLLSNAIKYTPSRGRIWVDAKEDGKNIHATVRDTGIGIPKKHQKKIFEPFYLVDSSLTRPYRGVGLGLAIARGIVEKHGGRIWVESKVGEGSTFHVMLPKMEEEKI